MFSYFFFLLYMARSILNQGAGSSLLNRSPSFPRFFEDLVPGIRRGGLSSRKPLLGWHASGPRLACPTGGLVSRAKRRQRFIS